MSSDKKKNYTGAEAKIDNKIKTLVLEHSENKKLTCAIADKIAKESNISAGDIGRHADLLDIRLSKCQMGLFGYSQGSKIVKPSESINPELEKAIKEKVVNDRLSCREAWDIASDMKISKLAVSNTCEALEIKINKCQLGAF